jgi:anti-sigma regulatory factor (Ser/Thr protein kinase)
MPLLSAHGGPVTTRIRVPDESHVGSARRAAAQLAAGLDEVVAGRLSLVVTELATNLARHAAQGELLLSAVSGGVEVISLDRGPGMTDLRRALEDGFSTGGTSGTGLGAVRRQADVFDAYTQPGHGTVIVCRVMARVAGASSSPSASNIPRAADARNGRELEGAVVCVPVTGEEACGDGWATHARPDGTSLVMVVDGLGHGPLAAVAADAATALFGKYAASFMPTQIVEAMHLALRPTRGAAVAVAWLDPAAQSIRFSGVGNIAASIVSVRQSQSLVSVNGIVGHHMGRTREFEYAWPEDAMLIMHSDGLTARWSLAAMPGVLSRDPGIAAGVLYRDEARGRDDVTVLAVRRAAEGSHTDSFLARANRAV